MQDSILGIDPGQDGGLCLIHGESVFLWDMPTIKLQKGNGKQSDIQFDVAATFNLLKRIKAEHSPTIYLEWNSVQLGEGAVSAVRIGEGRMLILALAMSLYIPCEKIAPQSWTKPLKLKGKGTTSESKKAAIAQRYELGSRLYPSISDQLTGPRGGKLDGRIDALLIAHYFKTKEAVAA